MVAESWQEGVGSCAALIFVRVVVVPVGGSMPADAEQKLAACGGAEAVFSTTRAFAAKCKNGTIVPWGSSTGTCHLP